MTPKAIKVSDLKRIPVGTKLLLVHSRKGECHIEREVARVSTVALYLIDPSDPTRTESEMRFPKANKLSGDQSGFVIYFGDSNEYFLRYIKPDWQEAPLF